MHPDIRTCRPPVVQPHQTYPTVFNRMDLPILILRDSGRPLHVGAGVLAHACGFARPDLKL